MRAFSEEYSKFKWSGRCPACGNRHLLNLRKALASWKIYDSEGQQVSRLTLTRLQPGSYCVCQKCGYKLMIFVADNPPAQPVAQLVEALETHRSEEPLGRDERVIDNLSNSREVTRKFLVSREWTRDYQLEREQTDRSVDSLAIGSDDIINLSFETERLLKERYSLAESTRETYAEEVTLIVPAKARLVVYFQWKKIWQHGIIRVRVASSTIVGYNFRVVSGITFDQTQSLT